MKLFTIAASLLSLLWGQGLTSAQTAYTQNVIRNWTNNNTAAGFTSDRLRGQVFNRSVPQYNFSNVNRGLFSGSAARGPQQKPFSGLIRPPTVSPYLGLLGNNPFTSTTDNYFNIVRPQLEQQRINQQLAQRNIQLQRQLNDVAAQGPYSPTGAVDRQPTGHGAVYMNYGGYYTPVKPVGVRGGAR